MDTKTVKLHIKVTSSTQERTHVITHLVTKPRDAKRSDSIKDEAHNIAQTAGPKEGFSLCVLSFCVSQFVEKHLMEAPSSHRLITSKSVQYFCFTIS